MAEKKRKKKKKEKKKKKNELEESHKASPTGIANNNETGSRSPCMRPRSDPPKMKNSTPDKNETGSRSWRKKKIKKNKNNEAN